MRKRLYKEKIYLLLLLSMSFFLFAGCQKEEQVVEPEEFVMGEESPEPNEAGAAKVEKVTSKTIETKKFASIRSGEKDLEISKQLTSGGNTWEKPKVILNPYGDAPLCAYILFETSEECSVRITVKGKTKKTNFSETLKPAKRHRVPVVGLYPGTENHIVLERLNTKGHVTNKKTVSIQTEELPESMKDIVRVEKHTKNSAYPFILVSGQTTPYPFAYDEEGNVRWYVKVKTSSYGVFPLSNGHFMLQSKDSFVTTEEKPHTTEMHEMDYMGRTHQIYYVKKGYHHEVIEKTKGGNLLILSSSIKGHVEDTVQEIDRKTGKIIKTLDMQEILGDKYVDMIDWCHLNTVSYREEDHSILISPRNVHSGIRVDWETNEVKWILGNPEFWEGTPDAKNVLKPIGSIIWHYQPHSIYEIPYDLDNNPDTSHIMVYDNHWNTQRKVDFFDGDTNSYVSVYVVDEKKETVHQTHTYQSVKSKITSNCAYDKKTNRIFSFGGYLDPLIDGRKGMIYEYEYESERCLNQYSLRYYFYRGYAMQIDIEALAAEQNTDGNDIKGTLLAPSKIEHKEIPDETVKDGVAAFWLKERVLYMETKDHSVMKVRFIGEKQTYVVDYNDARGGEAKYKNTAYPIAIPVGGLEPDHYQIVVLYDGEWYQTGKDITVCE